MQGTIKPKTTFFVNPETRRLMHVYMTFISREFESSRQDWRHVTDIFQKRQLVAGIILTYMSQNGASWDENCGFLIEDIGQNFLGCLAQDPTAEQSKQLFTNAVAFLGEFFFSLGQAADHTYPDLREIYYNLPDLFSMNPADQSQLKWLTLHLPTLVLRHRFSQNSALSMSALTEKAGEHIAEMTDMLSNLAEQVDKVDGLNDKVNRLQIKADFVALNHGFHHLKEQKDSAAQRLIFAMAFLWALILGIPFSSMADATFSPLTASITEFFPTTASPPEASNISELQTAPQPDTDSPPDYRQFYKSKAHLYGTLIAMISVEVLLLYLFRILLAYYNSYRAQIVQLELRQALCQFIQSYAKFAKDIKSDDGASLEKFETLIFSGIAVEPSQIPSTLDGVDQLAKLIQSIKK